MLCFGTCLVNIVFVETNLIVYRSIVHLEQGDVIFVGELVKVPVRDDFPYLAIDVAVSFVRVQHMVLSHPHQQVAGCDVLAIVEVIRCFLSLDWTSYLDAMCCRDDPPIGEKSCPALVFELTTLVLPQ